MKLRIIFGGTGYIGKKFCKHLIEKSYQVIAISSKSEPIQYRDKSYKHFALSEHSLKEVSESLVNSGIIGSSASVYVYNFAWKGIKRLTDGGLNSQLENISLLEDCIHFSEDISASKIITVGSDEEYHLENSIDSTSEVKNFSSGQLDYAIAKLYARDVARLICFLKKIDHIHLTFSTFIDPELSSKGYVSDCLMKIIEGSDFSFPKNPNYCDLVSMDDAVEAMRVVGDMGKDKANYFIGSGKIGRLADYFEIMSTAVSRKLDSAPTTLLDSSNTPMSIESLIADTGYTPKNTWENLCEMVIANFNNKLRT